MAACWFTARTTIDRPPGDVFAWVADYRNVRRVLDGVERWQPLGDRTRGVGARFDVSMRALGLPLENVLVLDRWAEARTIGWRSESGLIPQSGSWRFEPHGTGTDVTLAISYEAPGGAVGELLAARADGIVRRRLDEGLERMKELVERS